MGTNRNFHTTTFDAATELKDVSTAIIASGAGTVGGSARVVNVGQAILQAVMTVDFLTLDLAGGDESYEVRLQGSNDPTFATDISILASVRAGKGAAGAGEQDTGIGRRAVPFTNIGEDGTPLAYLRSYAVITVGAGSGSISYRAFITPNAAKGI